jgi:uncharacterized protein YndB with AHSA1/START domain
MKATKITVSATINAPVDKVWDSYTNPNHIVNWNFADPSWHCPSAENDMRVGGKYKARMEAKDGSFGFDLEAVYSELIPNEKFTYEMADREVTTSFKNLNNQTEVITTFDAENENPIEMQQQGWQMILNNFKNYTETL